MIRAAALCLLFALVCMPQPPGMRRGDPRTLSLLLRGLVVGEEQAFVVTRGGRTELAVTSRLAVGSGVELSGTLTAVDGVALTLDVRGRAPAFLDATTDAALTPAPGSFPIRSAFPLHVVAALVRHADQTGRSAFRTLSAATSTVERCPADTWQVPHASCYMVTGLTWGALVLWIDSAWQPVGAVVPTPWGLVSATEAAGSVETGDLLAHFARTTAARLNARVGRGFPAAEAVVLENVRVIDPVDGPADHRRVHLAAGRIHSIGAAGDGSLPGGVPVVDGTGLSVVPGLWDMHAHLKQADWGPAYLAAGVTSARDVGNDERFITTLRQEERAGRFPAPHLWLAAFIDGPATPPYTSVQATSAADARALVRHFAAAGFDQIKLWNNIAADLVPHVVDEARRVGLPVTRHHPSGQALLSSLAAGVRQINHLAALMDAAGGDLDSAAGRRLLQMLRAHHVVVDPTLVVTAYANRSLAAPLSALEPGARRAPPFVVRAWSGFGQPPDRANDAAMLQAGRFVKRLHDAGVPIVAGSDQGVPGVTLVRELELYVGAGLTPLEAIRTATSVPAGIMGVAGSVGRVRPGYVADLTLVEGNPAVSIRDLRRVRAVFKAGVRWAPDALWEAVEFEPR